MVFPKNRVADGGCDEWCVALHAVEKAATGSHFARYFDPDDFMIMYRVDDRHGSITLYKHIDTRRYLNADDQGGTYWYAPVQPCESAGVTTSRMSHWRTHSRSSFCGNFPGCARSIRSMRSVSPTQIGGSILTSQSMNGFAFALRLARLLAACAGAVSRV